MNIAGFFVGAMCLASCADLFAAADARGQHDAQRCLLEALKNASVDATVGEIRAACGEKLDADRGTGATETPNVPVYERSAIDERVSDERALEARPFVITPHHPNYIMWTAFDDPNQAPYEEVSGIDEPLEDTELKFQVSIKAPVWRNMLGSNVDTYFAYTATSWWQLSNDDVSAPFRETNYQPELFLRSFTDYRFLGMDIAGWTLGFNHQSNGRAEPLSRSWNRIVGQVGLGLTDDLSLLVRGWHRIEQDESTDDNPRIYRYLGYGDVRAVWTPNRSTFTAMVRPGSQETSYELTWSYPLSRVFRVYAQYYKGYGESLIDYDYENERIGIGIALNDFLMRN